MKKKISVLALVLVLISTLSFASGSKESTAETTASGEPQYGGTLTVLLWSQASKADPGSPDIADGLWAPTQFLFPIQDKMFAGDFEKYGPRGSGEFAFAGGFTPEEFRRGVNIEKWEVTPEKVTWWLRKGMYWEPNLINPDAMPRREATVEDLLADTLYFREAPGGKAFKKMTGNIYIENGALVMEFSEGLNFGLMYRAGIEDRALFSPPEIEGSKKWEDQVGTGPFKLKEYAIGSYFKYAKNPNYWGTTTINGKEYKIPFVDELIYPIIADESTAIAALRTAKIDYSHQVLPAHWKNLEASASGLKYHTETTERGWSVVLNCGEAPFDNKKVRQAMMIGTDRKAFGDMHQVGDLPLHWWPANIGNSSIYTPYDELSAENKQLINYDLDLAKKMLAEAGYPDGFDITYTTVSDSVSLDRASLLASQWSKLGVNVKIRAIERVAYQEELHKKTYGQSAEDDVGTHNPMDVLNRNGYTDAFFNFSQWSNSEFDALMDLMNKETDPVKRATYIKKASLIMLNEVPRIPTDIIPSRHYWWPWIKNYYGEMMSSEPTGPRMMASCWIDESLKKQMGF